MPDEVVDNIKVLFWTPQQMAMHRIHAYASVAHSVEERRTRERMTTGRWSTMVAPKGVPLVIPCGVTSAGEVVNSEVVTMPTR
jgi:hypothetical protein